MKYYFLFLFFAPCFLIAQNTGNASVYSDEYHLKKTASGDLYDINKFTAAHRNLPFHTRIRVTRLDNGKSVIVKVNDRGPFIDSNILDLSKAAAKKLGISPFNEAKVKFEIVNGLHEEDTFVVKGIDKPKISASKIKESAVVNKPIKVVEKEKKKEKLIVSKPEKEKIKKKDEKKIDVPSTVSINYRTKYFEKEDLYEVSIKRPEKTGYGIQIGVFYKNDMLLMFLAKLDQNISEKILVNVVQKDKKPIFKVLIGPYFEKKKATKKLKSLHKSKATKDAFIVNLGKLDNS